MTVEAGGDNVACAPIAGNYQLIVIHRFDPRSLPTIAFAGMKVSFGGSFRKSEQVKRQSSFLTP